MFNVKLNQLSFKNEATRTNRVICGGYQDCWFDSENGEVVEKYLDEWSCVGLDADGNAYNVVWEFENYTDGRIPDDCLSFDKEYTVKSITKQEI